MHQDTTQALKNLEKKVDRLVALCEKLEIENESLRAKQNSLVRDRAELLEKTTQARSRVEAMITRLKTMGQGT